MVRPLCIAPANQTVVDKRACRATRRFCKDNSDKKFNSCDAPQELDDDEIDRRLALQARAHTHLGRPTRARAARHGRAASPSWRQRGPHPARMRRPRAHRASRALRGSCARARPRVGRWRLSALRSQRLATSRAERLTDCLTERAASPRNARAQAEAADAAADATAAVANGEAPAEDEGGPPRSPR